MVRSFTTRGRNASRIMNPSKRSSSFWKILDCEENDGRSRFPGTWISRVSCGFRSDGASCFLPFQVRYTSGRSLIRSLNHGITYLFSRAISAVVREDNNRFREQYHPRSTYSLASWRRKGDAIIGDSPRQSRSSSTASSLASVTTRVWLSFRKRERSSVVLLTVAGSRPWPLARAA